ncbi:MAG: hypothetical protein LQ339_001857 [Xanthoria mediterranea]|nr:MAG: hypothetical protein LQ339_001857 [Xanthoria mediterranea]
MFNRRQRNRVEPGRWIRERDRDPEYISHIHDLRMQKDTLLDELNSLEADNTDLCRARNHLCGQITELQKQLDRADNDRLTAARKTGQLKAQLASKNRAYHELCLDYDELEEENRNLRRSLQQFDLQHGGY